MRQPLLVYFGKAVDGVSKGLVSLYYGCAVAIDIVPYGEHLHFAFFGIGQGDFSVRSYAEEFEWDGFAHFLKGDVFAEFHYDIVQAGVEDIDFFYEFPYRGDSAAGVSFEAFCRQFTGGEGYEQVFLRVVVEEGPGAEHGFSAVGTFVHEECAVLYRGLELRIKLYVDASDFFCVEVFTTVIAPHSANIANNAKIYSILCK